MTLPTIGCVALVVFAVAAPVDWWAVARRNKQVEYVTKPLALAALVVVAAVSDAPSDLRWWWVAALVLSLLGDVFLMVPKDLFIAGLASFLLAHVAYIGGFFSAGPFDIPLVIPLVGLGIVAAFLLSKMLRGPRMQAEMRLPVVLYVATILVMVSCAVATGSGYAAAGGLAFMTSDALIGWRRFIEDRPWMSPALIVLYHLGQLGLVLYLLA